jgi:hypothetical protein
MYAKGLQYGFPNLLFGWLDKPNQNMPSPLSSDFLMVRMACSSLSFAH